VALASKSGRRDAARHIRPIAAGQRHHGSGASRSLGGSEAAVWLIRMRRVCSTKPPDSPRSCVPRRVRAWRACRQVRAASISTATAALRAARRSPSHRSGPWSDRLRKVYS
jgi:hypothetical protein